MKNANKKIRTLYSSGISNLPEESSFKQIFADITHRCNMKFGIFPFKMSLRYDVPIYFSFISENHSGGFKILVVPLGAFPTPEEGVIAYRDFLESRIRENPGMWLYASEFKKIESLMA